MKHHLLGFTIVVMTFVLVGRDAKADCCRHHAQVQHSHAQVQHSHAHFQHSHAYVQHSHAQVQPAQVYVGHTGPYKIYFRGNSGHKSPYRYAYPSKRYPRYYGGTHARVIQNLGYSPADIGIRDRAW